MPSVPPIPQRVKHAVPAPAKKAVKAVLRGTSRVLGDLADPPPPAEATDAAAAPQPAAEPARTDRNDIPSDAFHAVNHELRGIELSRVPKGARRALSVGCNGRWYFDWFEQLYGPVDSHIGIEAYLDKPSDLQDYVTWIPDTADRMEGVGDAAVDLVFAGQTTEHLWIHELTGFLLEAHRVLSPGGLLAMDSPNRLVTTHLLWSHGEHTIELSAAEMVELAELAGFDVLTTTGIWYCRQGDRILTVEEGMADPAVFARRCALALDHPDDSFVWWINARRADRAPDEAAVRERIRELFQEHWDVRVNRGILSTPEQTRLPLTAGTVGVVAENLPFPLRPGGWEVELELQEGQWSSLPGLVVTMNAPGGEVMHRLALDDATFEQGVARWQFEQGWMLFAAVMRVAVDEVAQDCVLRLPIRVRLVTSPDEGAA